MAADRAISLAIVKDGKIAYAEAYGDARLEPKTAATADMRFKIASNSKQFLASAILLLAEDGKLTLDDRVCPLFPDLTRANEITIRQLLSHTSGYQDYYPLDYVAPFMAARLAPHHILDAGRRSRWISIRARSGNTADTNFTIGARSWRRSRANR